MSSPNSAHSIFGGSGRPGASSAHRSFSTTSEEGAGRVLHGNTTLAPQFFSSQRPAASSSDLKEEPSRPAKRQKPSEPTSQFTSDPSVLVAAQEKSDRPSASALSQTGSKRSLSGSDIPHSGYPKRRRPRLQPHSLKQPNSFNLSDLQDGSDPLSPLFFSNSPQARPLLPPRFSSSEAGAKMLSNTKGEDGNVRTVTLARGSYTGNSGVTPSPSYGKRISRGRVPLLKRQSPEPSGSPEQLHVLQQVGITEFLDRDDRPTFIVDLADSINLEAPGLSIVFANSALRSCEALFDAIQGRPEGSGTNMLAPTSFDAFKEWLFKNSLNGEELGGALPVFIQGSMSWSSSTLRNRFRVISGTFLSNPSRRASSTVPSTTTVRSEAQGTSPSSLADGSEHTVDVHDAVVLLRYQEAQDYFGNTEPHQPSKPSGKERVETHDFETARIARTHPKSVNGDMRSSDDGSHGEANPEAVKYGFDSVMHEAPSSDLDIIKSTSSDTVGFFDWTRLPEDDNMPPHVRFARSIDWASTSLGPIENWDADLRQMVNLIMASPHPAAMYWGEQLVAIYNEAYVYLAGQKHPKLMGQSYSEAWAEIWDDVKDVFSSAQTTGQATMKDDDCLFIKRSDVLEETYFSWSIIPMVGGDGRVMGLYNPAFEKTRRKIAERRMLTLREVGERTATARDVRAFWAAVLAALNCNEHDSPFLLLYSLAEDDSSEDNSVTESSNGGGVRQCYLEGSLGVPTDHPAAPPTMDLRGGSEGFAPIFRDAMSSNQTMVLDAEQDQRLAGLLEGLDWRGFGDPSRLVLVSPIHPTTGENTLGFLVLGVNPRRPYDDDYSLFIQLLSRQLATSLASVVLFEEEIKRGQKAAKIAALDRIELSEQLAARTQEAIDSETRFTRMAEFAPVGMFIANADGQITFCNDTWYDITRVPKSLRFAENWFDYVFKSDVPLVKGLWQDLIHRTKAVSSEFRFKAQWIDKSGATGETWVLFSAYPEVHDDGRLKSIFGSVTNISAQKWAEGLQKKKMEEAVELKRQQENFIDITSHEMRNPLSAILQCADEISSSLVEAKSSKGFDTDDTMYDNNIDAAQTIALCAQHQKRIVDDVLTMSKIDSALLMVTPVDAQPLTVVNRALKMFENELQSADIGMNFHVDSSFEKLGVDWVRLDPSRVMQVLINLTTNAIKFTTTEKQRTIGVTISASLQHPSLNKSTVVKYVPRRDNRIDMTQGNEWGTGEEVYIHFSVQDTGRGLSDEERKSLFLRFSQASPRTHVQYGGSGLGLFISRELTELQGGEIGVASVPGEGSTFAFFVKARRTKAPANPNDQLPLNVGSRRTSDGKSVSRKGPATKVKDFAQNNDNPEEQQQLKILLVEDNLVNQRVLQKQLKKLDCDVYVANHGREALNKIENSWFWQGKEGRPETLDVRVVLMDQEMPVLDGISATKQIRQLEQTGKIVRHVPILGITANARPEQIQQLIEAGMDDVVSKPFRITEILPKVKELSAKYRPIGMVQR